MDQSNIINKKILEQAVNEAVNVVRQWTIRELVNLINSRESKKNLTIIPIGSNGYIIGNYALKIRDDHCYLLHRYSDQELYFDNKMAGFWYAICDSGNRIEISREIKNYDSMVDKLHIEVNRFKYRLLRAKKLKNYHNIDLYSCRMTESVLQLRHYQFLLEKSLKSAKYLNFRNH
jgi:hypothetical protein